MDNSINTGPIAKQKLEDIINEQNDIIFDEKNWIKKDMWKIAEVTYSYDSETNINTTLFMSCGLLNLELYKESNKENQKKILLKSKIKLENLIKRKKRQIKAALNELEIIDQFSENEIQTDIKDIFIHSLKEKNNFLDYCLNSIPFELEKAGVENQITKEEEFLIEQKQETLDEKLFGGNIKNNTEEVILAYEYILEKYYKNRKEFNLDKQENLRFQGYLYKIQKLLPKLYKYQKKEKAEIIVGDFLNLDIPKSDYILGFNIITESLEKLGHVTKSNKDVKSISDGPKGVEFPMTKEFNFMKILRFFKLGNHEIETHNITDHNSNKLIGNMRGANSTEKDEGVAMLMEQLFMYGRELYKIDENGDQIIDIEKVQINSYFTKTLMGEILDNEELLDFLELSHKIDPDIISPKDRFDRLKRNNKEGVQHKDTTYTRGLLKAIKEINKFIKSKGKEGINPEDLFLGKISFDETHKLKKIKESREKKGEKIDLIKPLFISDAVYFAITEKLEGREGNITGEKFYKYLQEKYPIFNFTQEQVNELSYKTKRNVFGIVNIVLKNIGEHQINNIFIPGTKVTKSQLNIIKNRDRYKNNIGKVINQMDKSRQNAK